MRLFTRDGYDWSGLCRAGFAPAGKRRFCTPTPRTDIMRMLWCIADLSSSDIACAGMLAVDERPSRSANPATPLGNLLIAIEARDLLPAPLGEGVGTAFARTPRRGFRRKGVSRLPKSSELNNPRRFARYETPRRPSRSVPVTSATSMVMARATSSGAIPRAMLRSG